MHLQHPSMGLYLVWTGLVLGSIKSLSVSDILVVVGALAFAAASARNGRMKLLRDTNADLTARNAQLEEEKVTSDARLAKLEAEPNLEQHAVLLAALESRMAAHDRAMMEVAERQRVAFKEVVRELKAIHVAVVPPLGIRG